MFSPQNYSLKSTSKVYKSGIVKIVHIERLIILHTLMRHRVETEGFLWIAEFVCRIDHTLIYSSRFNLS
jgi:hypothetical protein